jgi:hypothetical protein
MEIPRTPSGVRGEIRKSGGSDIQEARRARRKVTRRRAADVGRFGRVTIAKAIGWVANTPESGDKEEKRHKDVGKSDIGRRTTNGRRGSPTAGPAVAARWINLVLRPGI